jgi:hypothetical protein
MTSSWNRWLPLTAPSDRTVFSHIQQACLKKKELASWIVVLPTPELLSALCSRLPSNANWERVQKAQRTTEHLFHAHPFYLVPPQHKVYVSFFPLVQLPLESMNYVMACYACHLATGHSLSSRTLKVTPFGNTSWPRPLLLLYLIPSRAVLSHQDGLLVISPVLRTTLSNVLFLNCLGNRPHLTIIE